MDMFEGLPKDLVAKFKAAMLRVSGSEEKAEKKWAFLNECSLMQKMDCIEAYLKATQG